ncbi:MAG: DUF2345 domain-containing protein [Methanosarcinaceae archaeon]|nr:DUF2345 domain-containing protein [Methanosarcinaceae archaeon]
MSLLDMLEDRETRTGINGLVIGIVTNNKDPDGHGRIKVKFPWLSDEDESNWCRIVAPMAGNNMGVFFLPDVDDEVLVGFQHGDINMPFVLGSLWNGKDKPPEKNDDGKNNIRMIRSRSGHTIKLDDTEGNEKIEIIDKTEKNVITIETKNNKLSLKSEKDIEISAPNGKVTINAKDIVVSSTASAKIESSAGLDLKTSGNMNIKGSMVNIN